MSKSKKTGDATPEPTEAIKEEAEVQTDAEATQESEATGEAASAAGDAIVLSNADYNAAVAEHGNAGNFCKKVHGKALVNAVQGDGHVTLTVGPSTS